MDEKKTIREILCQDLDIKAAIQIAKIISHAPEERLPMILDVFGQVGIEISGMEAIEELKEVMQKRIHIDNLDSILEDITKMAPVTNGEHRIPVEMFDRYCDGLGVSTRNLRRTLAEMGILRLNTYGKQNFSIPVYNPNTKAIQRCICVKEDWRDMLGVD